MCVWMYIVLIYRAVEPYSLSLYKSIDSSFLLLLLFIIIIIIFIIIISVIVIVIIIVIIIIIILIVIMNYSVIFTLTHKCLLILDGHITKKIWYMNFICTQFVTWSIWGNGIINIDVFSVAPSSWKYIHENKQQMYKLGFCSIISAGHLYRMGVHKRF